MHVCLCHIKEELPAEEFPDHYDRLYHVVRRRINPELYIEQSPGFHRFGMGFCNTGRNERMVYIDSKELLLTNTGGA